MICHIKNIVYDIEPAELSDEICIDDFALESDYIKACEDRIDAIVEKLPSELNLEIEGCHDGSEIEDLIADAISDITGWLVRSFNYEI